MHILSSSSFQLNNICNNLDCILLRYKNVSKTDVRASWIQHPKRAPPKQTTTMEELFPPPPNIANYRYVSSHVKFKINELAGIISFHKICFTWHYMQLYIIIHVQCTCILCTVQCTYILCTVHVAIDKSGYCILKCPAVNNIFITDNN